MFNKQTPQKLSLSMLLSVLPESFKKLASLITVISYVILTASGKA